MTATESSRSAEPAGPAAAQSEPRYLIDPYGEWAEGEGIPIHLDFGHDLLALETAPWDVLGEAESAASMEGNADDGINGGKGIGSYEFKE